MLRQVFLGFARAGQELTGILDGEWLEFRGFEDPAEDALVEVVTTQRGVATGRHHFEYALRQIEYRDIEGAAAQIINGVNPSAALSSP